jgi:2-polyprenyl-3-methyl-5-hydroxy-6-metoxy-1,4-benzoquinol methylase
MFGENQVIERIDPINWEEARSNEIVKQHSNRYIWAREFMDGSGDLVDVACGVGYGTWYLAKKVYQAYGIDISEQAIDHANKYFDASNIMWVCNDATKDIFEDISYITCFETIEHIEDDKSFIKQLYEWLHDEEPYMWDAGILLISAPNENIVPLKKWPNPYHYRHYTPDGLRAILEPYFEIIEVKFQNKEGTFKDDEDMIVVIHCKKKGEND